MTTLGRCKCCAWEHVKELNRRLANDEALTALAAWADGRGFKVTRQKLADHKAHITDPRQTFVENARRNPAIKAGVTNDEFLQAVIDVAAQKAAEDPDSIGIAHGLKAVQIREARKEKQLNVLLVLAERLTALPTQPTEVIEGDWTEVPALEEAPAS